MYEKISAKAAGYLAKNGIIEQSMLELYAFGLEGIISQLGSIMFLLLAGAVLGALWEAVIYFFVFMLVRKYAGGYHAQSYVRCNTLYLITFAAVVFGTRAVAVLGMASAVSIGAVVFSLFAVVLLAPIENPNNPIKPGKERAYIVLSVLIELLCGAAVFLLHYFVIGIQLTVALTMFCAAVYMYVEIIKRRINPMNNFKKKICNLVAAAAKESAKSTRREVSKNGIYQAKAPAALLKNDKI